MKGPFTHLLYATDFSNNARLAGDEAVRLARRWGARLTVVFVNTDLPLKRRWRKLPNAVEIEEALRASGLKKLEDLTAPMQDASGMNLRFAALEGKEAAETILSFITEQGCDFLVIGSHGTTAMDLFSVGSVAIQLIRHSTVPVLTVRPDLEEGFQRILAPVDFSEASKASLALAAMMLRQADDAALHVLHSFEPLGIASLSLVSSGQEEDYRHQIVDTEREALEEFIEGAALKGIDPVVEVLCRAPDQAILEYAEAHDIDLICMGTVGRSGLSAMFVGNTAERILRGTTCSMLTTRSEQD